jgi:hypothetical protein
MLNIANGRRATIELAIKAGAPGAARMRGVRGEAIMVGTTYGATGSLIRANPERK